MRMRVRILMSLVLVPLAAQAGDYSIDWFTVAGGGLRSSSGSYVLHGTVGQPAAGVMAKGNYSVVGGFWSFSATRPSGSTLADPLAGFYSGIDLSDPAQAGADTDGDGFSNLMEYALGTDPRTPGDAQGAIATSLVQSGSDWYLTLQFKRRKPGSGLALQYIPE